MPSSTGKDGHSIFDRAIEEYATWLAFLTDLLDERANDVDPTKRAILQRMVVDTNKSIKAKIDAADYEYRYRSTREYLKKVERDQWIDQTILVFEKDRMEANAS